MSATTVAPDPRPAATQDSTDAATATGTATAAASATATKRTTAPTGLGAEVRESLLLLGFAVGVTVGLTTAAQAALALLG